MFEFNDSSNVMDAFNKGKLKADLQELYKHSNKQYELGYPINILPYKYGSLSQYTKLSKDNKVYLSNYQIPYTVNIETIDEKEFEQNRTNTFKENEIPILVLKFSNFMNNKQVYVTWVLDTEQDIEQAYNIPSAYSKNNNWWTTYGLVFIGPEHLKQGTYSINVRTIDKWD